MTKQPIAMSVSFLPPASQELSWLPSADVYHSPQGWLIKVDLAGVRRGDVTITISGSRLVVSGCRRDLVVNQAWRPFSMEIAYTRFERTIELPGSLHNAEINAELSEGMLLIYVTPKEGTEAGGDVLYVEAALLPEGKSLLITGQLGEVMQESAKAAQSYLWSHADELGIERALFKEAGVHIHVPAGAIPKDGPSAGVTMATALTSLYTKTPTRGDTAMTGEITLTGLVLPIGGVKEKVLAARRVGIRRVILPKGNQKDLRELPDNVRAEMEFLFAERIEEVLAAAIPKLSESMITLRAA